MKNKKKKVRAYMCATTFYYEFGEGDTGPYKIYDNLKDCRKKCECCKDCGIIELEIKEVGYAQIPNRKWDLENAYYEPPIENNKKLQKTTETTKKGKKSVKNNRKGKTKRKVLES